MLLLHICLQSIAFFGLIALVIVKIGSSGNRMEKREPSREGKLWMNSMGKPEEPENNGLKNGFL